MILYGPKDNQSECSKIYQATASMAQLLDFNSQVRQLYVN